MQRIPLLNGLRGLAILGVIFHHSFFLYILYAKGRHLTPFALVGSSGWLGVNLFFFLSGFVLFLPYAEGNRAFDSGRAFAAYYSHRAKRLLPLYYLTTLVFLLLLGTYQLTDPKLYRDLLNYVFATFIYSRDTFFPSANWVLWSLGVEIWFSIAFPFIVLAIKKYGWAKVLVAILLVSLLTRILGRTFLPNDARPAIFWLPDSILGRMDEFTFGMLGATLFVKRWRPARPAIQLASGIILLSVAMVLWAFWYRGHFPSIVAGFFNIPFDLGLLLAINGLLSGCQPISKLLSSWPLQISGLMCYSLYLWHGQIIAKYRTSADTIPTYLAYLVLIYGLSWVTYRYVEFGSVKDWRTLVPGKSRANAEPERTRAST